MAIKFLVEIRVAPLLKKHANGIKVILNPVLQNPAQYVGQKATLDGTQYTIVDNASLKAWAAADKTNAVCTTLVTNMTDLFFSKTSQDIEDWDVSEVTDMTGMFFETSDFDQDLTGWDVNSVTSCTTFSGRSAFSQSNHPPFSNCTP